jgi:Tfp pilus assembly protein PilN
MSRIEGSVDELNESSKESRLRFVLTLIVTTVIVVFAVYVLGLAVLDRAPIAPAHRAAITAMHAHS